MKLTVLLFFLLMSMSCYSQEEDLPDIKEQIQKSYEKTKSAPPSADKIGEAKEFNAYDENYERFQNSPCFGELGFIPGRDNEKIYRDCEEGKRKSESNADQEVGMIVITILALIATLLFFVVRYKRSDESRNTSIGSLEHLKKVLAEKEKDFELLNRQQNTPSQHSLLQEASLYHAKGDTDKELECYDKVLNQTDLPLAVHLEVHIKRAYILYYENKLSAFRMACVKAFELLPVTPVKDYRHYDQLQTVYNMFVKDTKENNSTARYSAILNHVESHLSMISK